MLLDVSIETGIAHGGPLIYGTPMPAILDMAVAIALGNTINPKTTRRKVPEIDTDTREHNRAATEAHPQLPE